MWYKLSYYTIVTDPLNSVGDRVIYSTRTGQALIIKQGVWTLLATDRLELMDPDDKNRLLEVKIIVPQEEEELLAIINENKQNTDDSSVLYEVIQVSANCQLGCDYCGQHHDKQQIPSSMYEALLNRIRLKAGRKKYTRLYIGWFGGEPLVGLRQIRELTPLLGQLAADLGLSFGTKIVTNGMSLKEDIFFELTRELWVDHIEVTLDGIAEFHDTRRITKQGAATFDIIFNNLLSILNHPEFDPNKCRVSLRCNVDERNEAGVSPLISILSEHKLQDKIAYFYPIGVYSWARNDAQKKSMTKEEFARKEIEWYMELIQNGFSVNLIPGRVKSVCMATSNTSDLYDPYGNIFSCTEVSLTPVYERTAYLAGNLKFPADTYSSTRMHANWNDEILAGKFPCHSCRMLPVCGGACPKSWHEDMRACPPSKFNIREKLQLAYIVSKSDLNELINNEESVLSPC
jgi:uncharacterized protein